MERWVGQRHKSGATNVGYLGKYFGSEREAREPFLGLDFDNMICKVESSFEGPLGEETVGQGDCSAAVRIEVNGSWRR